ncbi:DUF3231 family protein [Priestia aryabhattai]|uniref:DUF3231 family protein n=1 Tax=Priestia aryabhattai TaxID=412384 RepID=UPI003D292D20
MNAESKRLTSPEITSLCTQYQQDTLEVCIAKHVLATVTNAKIRSLFAFSLELSKKHIEILTAIFRAEHFPLPHGFTDEDVDLHEENLHTPPLLDNEITTSTHAPFSEKLMTFHAGAMFKVAITYYATAMTTSMRLDIVGHCEACILRDLKVAGRCSEVMIKNGWIEKPPEASDRKQM